MTASKEVQEVVQEIVNIAQKGQRISLDYLKAEFKRRGCIRFTENRVSVSNEELLAAVAGLSSLGLAVEYFIVTKIV